MILECLIFCLFFPEKLDPCVPQLSQDMLLLFFIAYVSESLVSVVVYSTDFTVFHQCQLLNKKCDS